MIIHLVGDIHQPLHTVSLVDYNYLSGDHGGNSEVFPSICGVKNLHGVWDSIAYNFCSKLQLPLSEKDWDWYTSESTTIASEYPVLIIDTINDV
jgi:hypothetical protein